MRLNWFILKEYRYVHVRVSNLKSLCYVRVREGKKTFIRWGCGMRGGGETFKAFVDYENDTKCARTL